MTCEIWCNMKTTCSLRWYLINRKLQPLRAELDYITSKMISFKKEDSLSGVLYTMETDFFRQWYNKFPPRSHWSSFVPEDILSGSRFFKTKDDNNGFDIIIERVFFINLHIISWKCQSTFAAMLVVTLKQIGRAFCQELSLWGGAAKMSFKEASTNGKYIVKEWDIGYIRDKKITRNCRRPQEIGIIIALLAFSIKRGSADWDLDIKCTSEFWCA